MYMEKDDNNDINKIKQKKKKVSVKEEDEEL